MDIVDKLLEEIKFSSPTAETMQEAVNEIRKLRGELHDAADQNIADWNAGR